MKRILLISRCPPWPLYLGDRLILYHLAYELDYQGYEIDLLAFANRPEDWREQNHYDAYFRSVHLFPEPRRTPASYLKRAFLPRARWPRRAQQAWSPDMWRAIQTRLAETRYDAVHLFGGVQVYEFFHALNGQPALITPYESYSLYLRRQLESLTPHFSLVTHYSSLITSFRFTLARRFERFMFTPYRRVVVVSGTDRDELLSLNPSLNLDVIPNGVDLYHFRPRPTRRIPALLFVGNYEYPPNVEAAIRLARDILPAVQARIPGVRLWLVGNAPPPELRALANDSRLKPTVRVTGRVPDVRPYLARAAAFVSPLRLGAGIKNKLLEALAMGCPVVATPLSLDGIDITDGHDALMADTGAMADVVVNLLNQSDLQHQLAINGRKLVESRYSWTKAAMLYQELYDTFSGHTPHA